MMRKMAWGLFILAVFCLPLTSCGSGREESGDLGDSRLSADDVTLQFYAGTAYPLPGGYAIAGIARLDSCLLLAGNGAAGAALGFVDYTLTDAGRVTLSEAQIVRLEDPDVTVYGAAAGGDGYFHVLTGAREGGDLEQGNFSLLCYSREGALQGSVPLSCGPDASVDGVQAGDGGEIVLYGCTKGERGYVSFVSLFSDQGEPVHTELPDGLFIRGSALCAEGIVFSGVTTHGEGFYALLDSGSGRLAELDVPAAEVGTGSQSSCQGLDGEYIIDTGDRYLEYDMETGESRELLRWSDGSIGAPLAACRLGEHAFVCYTGGDAVYLLGMEPAGIGDRSVVNVALIDVDDPDSVLRQMNQNSERYEYRVSGSYSSANAGEIDRFLTEMMTGRAPDLVLTRGPAGINTDSGLFDDLYPYIDADETLSRDGFIPNLLQTLSCGGELHQLWEAVEIYTLAARVSDVGDGAGLTPEDYNRIVEENERYQAVFERYVGKSVLLGWISNVGNSAFVDRENASCSFDSQAFRDLLAWCGDVGDDVPEGSSIAPYDASEVVLLFDPLQDISVPEAGRRYVSRMERLTGEPCVFVGFPNGDSGFSYYGNSGLGTAMAIPVQSQNKEGAWAFVRERLSMDHQMEKGAYGDYVCGLPAIDAAMRRRAEAELSEEDAAELYALMESIQYAQTFSSKSLRTIIQEAGQAYLAGDKTLDEAAALIQSRAGLWVAEQYG